MNDLELPPTTPVSKRGTRFMVILVLCYLVSFAGSEGVLRGLGDWYPSLARPPWAPPMWLFVPLWTVLYGAMAVAVWQVWEAGSKRRAAAMGWVTVTAVLGGLWPWLFFFYRSMLFSALEGVAVWALTGLTIWAFSRVRTSAALLLVPYWAWAAYLSILAFFLHRSMR